MGRLPAAEAGPERGERFVDLARVGDVRVELILSSDTPDEEFYDQAHDEWVVVLDGAAVVEVEGRPTSLEAGDWMFLPARTVHRVLATRRGTRWLALHGPD
jgi:cupin 2 domain-containing protein